MIINLEQSYCEYITTDDSEFMEYRRNSAGEWECLMGMSWEYINNSEHLEKQYLEYNFLRDAFSKL